MLSILLKQIHQNRHGPIIKMAILFHKFFTFQVISVFFDLISIDPVNISSLCRDNQQWKLKNMKISLTIVILGGVEGETDSKSSSKVC